MNTTSCPARHVPGLWVKVVGDESYQPEAGNFEVLEDADGPKSMAICCPGCKSTTLLSLRSANPPVWQFDGNRLKPTLQPSIHHVGCWHGWLRAGEFVSCC